MVKNTRSSLMLAFALLLRGAVALSAEAALKGNR